MDVDKVGAQKEKIMLSHTLPRLLKNKGLTFKKLAQLSNVSSSTLYEWKNGREPQNIHHLKTISNILKVSLHYLLYGKQDPYQINIEKMNKNIIEGNYNITIKKNGDL